MRRGGAPRRLPYLRQVAVRRPLAALFLGPVLYYVFRAVYGGPNTPSYKAGDEAITVAVAEAAEDAAR